jgi:1,2-diacylglycerol 3-beta-glucosyltransferase
MKTPRRLLATLQAPFAVSVGYLLVLLVAAERASRAPAAITRLSPARGADAEPLPLTVIVPAHDEEDGIAATLASLLGGAYPAAARRVVVVADNCEDRTAAVAAAAGAEVWERTDPDLRGKGHALAWALDRLLAEPGPPAGIVFVDADCVASPNLLEAVERRLRAGTRALQVDYLAGNPEDSRAAALRFAAFAVGDTVRFLGKERLGLSVGLVGTGMGFSRELLERVPWTVTGLVEDGEFHMRLVLAGERVEFVPEASVSQAVPTSLAAGASQQARWEMGKAQLVRRWSGKLVASGLRRRDRQRLHAGLEAVLPPQSVLALGNLAGGAAALALGSRRLLAVSVLSMAGQAAFVLGGLRLVGAPAYVYRSLLSAPVLVADKLGLYLKLAGGRGPTGWVRTVREPAASNGAGGANGDRRLTARADA